MREAHPITLADSEPEPDIAIVRGSWPNYRQRHPGPEDIFLLVEISDSSLTKDLELKKSIYAAAGIQEYWVLDLTKLRLIMFRNPQRDNYQSRQEFQEGAIAPIAFPDIEISRLPTISSINVRYLKQERASDMLKEQALQLELGRR